MSTEHPGDTLSKPKRPHAAPYPTFKPYFDLLTATALGDSLGLPYENLRGWRIRAITKGKIRQRFFFGVKGMVSDDTEHALITARSLLQAGNDPKVFERQLSKRLKYWLSAFPPAVGLATLKSIMLMWFKTPSKCGRPSAGNGPLMRAPIIGLYHAENESLRDSFVKTSTQMTHSDPRATFMASGVADIIAASLEGRLDWPAMSDLFRKAAGRHAGEDDETYLKELYGMLDALDTCYAKREGCSAGLAAIGCVEGIDGYVYRSALGATYIASHSSSVYDAISRAVLHGGDTDSTAALAGAIAAVGSSEDLSGEIGSICDWPISLDLIQEHADELGFRQPCDLDEPAYLNQLLRNVLFFLLDVGHILRRLLPPYR